MTQDDMEYVTTTELLEAIKDKDYEVSRMTLVNYVNWGMLRPSIDKRDSNIMLFRQKDAIRQLKKIKEQKKKYTMSALKALYEKDRIIEEGKKKGV